VTFLLVVIGAVAVGLGARWADPVVGLLIADAILIVGYPAPRSVGQCLLDAVDPSITNHISEVMRVIGGVTEVTEVRARWAGHRLLAQVRLSIESSWSVAKAHEIAEETHHALVHQVQNLSDAIVHVDPAGSGVDAHASTKHHASAL
jgi:divalent metal cation (Fe/Co/Zn/Cd) transporter